MPSAVRGSVFAFLCFAVFANGSPAPAMAQDLDTGALPRMTGAKQVYASPQHTIFTSPDPLPKTTEFVRNALAAQGWQEYGRPFTSKAQNPNAEILEFKRGPQGLSTFISVAPAQGNAISVSYTAIMYPIDLPFPKDATEIEFDPTRPHLNSTTVRRSMIH
jgi:hypothetical protein